MIKTLVKHPVGRFYVNIIYCMDLLTNTITLGDARETVSSVLGKKELEGCKTCSYFCAVLSFMLRDPGHCNRSIMPDIGYGTTDNWSPVPGIRRRMSNAFVLSVLITLWYREELLNFVTGLIL